MLAKDGSFIIEGFFKEGVSEGPFRIIKMSKRKKGCFTIREGVYCNGEAHAITQTKIKGKERCQTSNSLKDGYFHENTSTQYEHVPILTN